MGLRLGMFRNARIVEDLFVGEHAAVRVKQECRGWPLLAFEDSSRAIDGHEPRGNLKGLLARLGIQIYDGYRSFRRGSATISFQSQGYKFTQRTLTPKPNSSSMETHYADQTSHVDYVAMLLGKLK